MKKLFTIKLITLFTWLIAAKAAQALPISYNPLTTDEQKIQQRTRIKPKKKSLLSYSLVQTGSKQDRLEIKIKNQLSYTEKKNFYPKYLNGNMTDIDGNKLDDLIFQYWPGSMGLSLGCGIVLYLQQPSGTFQKLTLPTEQFQLKDIFDIDGDGIFEIITALLVKYNGHSYWLYRCWQIKNHRILNVDEKFDFPRAIWFTHKPNDTLLGEKTTKKILSKSTHIETQTNFFDNQQQPAEKIITMKKAGKIRLNLNTLFSARPIADRKKTEKDLVELVSPYKLPEKNSVEVDNTWSSAMNFASAGSRAVLLAFVHAGTGCYISFWAIHEFESNIKVFSFEGSQKGCGPWQVLNDLDSDGNPEIITKHFVGSYDGAGTTAVWPAIYKWNGKNYIRADEKFPEYYAEYVVPQYKKILAENKKWANHNDKAVRRLYHKCKFVYDRALKIAKKTEQKRDEQ